MLLRFQILQWEAALPSSCEEQPRLKRFTGRPQEYSPKARLLNLLVRFSPSCALADSALASMALSHLICCAQRLPTKGLQAAIRPARLVHRALRRSEALCHRLLQRTADATEPGGDAPGRAACSGLALCADAAHVHAMEAYDWAVGKHVIAM